MTSGTERNYLLLLAAIVRRARMDADGRFTELDMPAAYKAVMQEADEFVTYAAQEFAPLADADIPERRQSHFV